jgi:hypothetical protein
MISSSRIVTSLESLLRCYIQSSLGHALFNSSRLICAAEILEATPFSDCSYLRFGLIGFFLQHCAVRQGRQVLYDGQIDMAFSMSSEIR